MIFVNDKIIPLNYLKKKKIKNNKYGDNAKTVQSSISSITAVSSDHWLGVKAGTNSPLYFFLLDHIHCVLITVIDIFFYLNY